MCLVHRLGVDRSLGVCVLYCVHPPGVDSNNTGHTITLDVCDNMRHIHDKL